MKRLRYENGSIDKLDRLILAELVKNARISNAELSRLIGLSAPSISERIKRLEEAGVITGYTVKVNMKALGLPLAVWLRIKPIPGQLPNVLQVLSDLPEIVECDRVTGEDCFMARAYVCSMEHLEEVIDKIIPYATTTTSIIQSSPVQQRLYLA